MQRYAPISKMEQQSDGTLKVWGVASTEAVDKDGEVIRASAMKEALPDYMEWGAIREMHSNIAAGTCLEAGVNEETGQTLICAHVVDPTSVLKVQKGVLKGFSIGGTATATDPLNKKVITGLVLNEISLVDKPANPEAVITLWKADMSTKPTQPATPAPEVTGEQLGNEIEALVKGGHMSIGEIMSAVQKAAKSKTKAAMCPHGVEKGKACDKCDGGMAIAKADGEEMEKRDYSEDERTEMAGKGEALPDGSFPIKDETDLKNAIKAYGRAKDKEKAKKHIEARAKALGKEDLLPESWDEKAEGESNGYELGSDEKAKAAGAVAPAGGTQEPAGSKTTADGATEKGTADTNAALGAAGNPVTKSEVGPGTKGPDNATVLTGNPGTIPGGTAPNANTPMLQKPKIGDLVTIAFGEDEVGGHIAEIRDLAEGGNEVVVKNGDAWLAVNSAKLIHHELNGDKVHWKVTTENTADFTAAKAAQSARITAALQKAFKGEGHLQKGMWTVGNWADIMQSIVWLCKDIKWESAAEGDEADDSLERRLAACLKVMGELMLEYAEDQLKEIFNGVCDPDNIPDFVIELAAKPGELQKFAEGGVPLGRLIQKAVGGAGNPDALGTAIQKAVDAGVAAALDKLQKAHATELDTLQKRIKQLEDMPVPPKGVTKGVAVVARNDEAAAVSEEPTVKPVMKNGAVDEAATAIKKSFSQPQTFNRLANS